MHCSDEALMQSNDSITRLYVKECMQCQQRLWQLKQLKSDANRLPLYQPSELAWQNIKKTLPKQKKPYWFQSPVTIAASFVVGIIVTLVGNNLWQTHTVDVQIAKSSQFEQQLIAMQGISPFMENELWELSQIDEKLSSEQDKSKKKALWKKRNIILQKLLKQSSATREII